MRLRKLAKHKGQTALEYAMMIAIIVVPVALTIRSALESDESDRDDAKKSITRTLVDDAYGTEKQLGVIGRPYP